MRRNIIFLIVQQVISVILICAATCLSGQSKSQTSEQPFVKTDKKPKAIIDDSLKLKFDSLINEAKINHCNIEFHSLDSLMKAPHKKDTTVKYQIHQSYLCYDFHLMLQSGSAMLNNYLSLDTEYKSPKDITLLLDKFYSKIEKNTQNRPALTKTDTQFISQEPVSFFIYTQSTESQKSKKVYKFIELH